MIYGLPLADALKVLSEHGEQPQVIFTTAPRRARVLADGEMPPEYIARVIGYAPGRVICAWFYEPRP